MTFALDFSEDLLTYCSDFLESATLKVSGESDVALTDCVLTEPLDKHEMEPSDGQVPQRDTLFVWPVSESSEPPLGSIMVDGDGTYWTLLNVRHKQHVECWEAHGRNLSIVSVPNNVATILKAGYGKGDDNEALADWVGAVSGEAVPTEADQVAARFQPSLEAARLFLGADFSKETYRVIFDSTPPIELAGGEYRLVDSDGYRYRIMEYFQEQRIDLYPVAIAVRILEGAEYAGYPST